MIAFARARSPDVETEDVVEDEVTSRARVRASVGMSWRVSRKLLRVLFTIDEQIPTHHHDHTTVRRRLRVQRHDLVFHLLKRIEALCAIARRFPCTVQVSASLCSKFNIEYDSLYSGPSWERSASKVL